MPTVADELAALRAHGSVKAHATSLTEKTSSGGGAALSTPEAEEAALRAKRESDKLENVRAKEFLSRGSQGAAEASAARAAQLAAMRREDMERKAEASEILKKGGSGYSREVEQALNQTGKKKAEWEKKNEAKKILNSGRASPSNIKDGLGKVPAAAMTAAAAAVAAPEAHGEEEYLSEAAPEAAAPAIGKGPEEITREDAKVELSRVADPIEKMGEKMGLGTSLAAPVEAEDDDDDDAVPKLEEVDDDDAVPELKTPDREDDADVEEGGGRHVTNRHEKKTRKMMTRLGMRPVPGIARVTFKTGKGGGYFFIDRPDVFFGGGGAGGKVDNYVIFGEARQGGPGVAQAQASARAQMAAIAAANATASSSGGAVITMPSAGPVVVDDDVPALDADEAVDEDGVDAKDVDLVMSQASCSRAKAAAALMENDGDLVNAIMSLTT
jgi:nascent polypeptide-associated complex subunit alpha